MISQNALGRAAFVAGLLLTTSLLAGEAATPQSAGEAASAARAGAKSGALAADDAILATLKNAKPMPVPMAPKGGFAAWRAGKRPTAVANFGAVTRTLGTDGETSTRPASEEIEQSIKKESALPAPEESANPEIQGAAEAAPVADPGAQVERKVFGRDDRVRIGRTNTYPFRVIGLLQMKFPGDGDARYFCSGSLIGPRTVLTAAHCLYDIERRLWPEEVLFFPGLDGDSAPYGYYDSEYVTVVAGYADAPTRVYDWQHVMHDMGLVLLRARAGSELGTLGYGYNDGLPPFVGNIVGYPMDMPFGTMWRASCDIDTFRGYPAVFETSCDTFQGSSGSSIYDFNKRTNDRIVYGVNVAENPQFNTGLRITGPYYAWIQQNVR